MSAISDWLFGAADGTPLEGNMLRRPDILQESWHGVSLAELVRSQLSSYLDRTRPQVLIVGDGVLLKPDVAQSLGLALHELASNAEKSGALSVPDGRLWIAWRRVATKRWRRGAAVGREWRSGRRPAGTARFRHFGHRG
jgi:two-component sensor histidine kinase